MNMYLHANTKRAIERRLDKETGTIDGWKNGLITSFYIGGKTFGFYKSNVKKLRPVIMGQVTGGWQPLGVVVGEAGAYHIEWHC